MVAGWTRFATDECPRCLSTAIERSSSGWRCQCCGTSLERSTPKAPALGTPASVDRIDGSFVLNPKFAIVLILLLLMLAYLMAGRVDPNGGMQNSSCSGNCMTGNMASL